MPKFVIAGNWKMYKTRREAISLVDQILERASTIPEEVELLVFPAFTALSDVAERCRGTRLMVGGQNLHPAREGAFTGEISARMLLDAGVTHVLIGHSERRSHFRETDAFLAEKVAAALAAGLVPVFCLGETLEERESGRTEEVLSRSLEQGLGMLSGEELSTLRIAYEPVWAIGTGRTASPDQARDAHRFLRSRLDEHWGGIARDVPLLYGGSVKPGNAAELLAQPEVNGLLVGGASLEGPAFVEIAGAVPRP